MAALPGKQSTLPAKPADGFPKKIAEHAITILVNLSADREVLQNLATDDGFLDAVLARLLVG